MKTLPSVTLANTQIWPAGSALSLMKSSPGLLRGPTAPQAAFLKSGVCGQAGKLTPQCRFSSVMTYSTAFPTQEKKNILLLRTRSIYAAWPAEVHTH